MDFDSFINDIDDGAVRSDYDGYVKWSLLSPILMWSRLKNMRHLHGTIRSLDDFVEILTILSPRLVAMHVAIHDNWNEISDSSNGDIGDSNDSSFTDAQCGTIDSLTIDYAHGDSI